MAADEIRPEKVGQGCQCADFDEPVLLPDEPELPSEVREVEVAAHPHPAVAHPDDDVRGAGDYTQFVPVGCPSDIARCAVGNATNQVYVTAYNCIPPVGTEFIRGDVDGDGAFNPLVDGVAILNFGFIPGSAEPPCLAQADANGDDAVNPLVEGVFLLNFGFIPGSEPIPPPYPDCGLDQDTVDAVGCDDSPCP